MNVFELRDRLIRDYASYISSFIQIRDARISQHVDRSLSDGLLWPEPLIQLNPSFEPGDSIDELVRQRILHDECRRIFRIGKDKDPAGKPLRLHRHQADAVRVAHGGHNYVLTTGTGSGKSLAYIVPIVDHVLRHGTGRGIQAIVVYPMNALANSQKGELEKFLWHGYPDGKGPVTFGATPARKRTRTARRSSRNPPDILLTNYVMLELILTRPRGAELIQAAQGLRFLVLDELHTYRGRQGADVALLVRRVRDALSATGSSASARPRRWRTHPCKHRETADRGRRRPLWNRKRRSLRSDPSCSARPSSPNTSSARPYGERHRNEARTISHSWQRCAAGSAMKPAVLLSSTPASSRTRCRSGSRPPSASRPSRATRGSSAANPSRSPDDDGAARDLSRLTGLPEDRCVEAIQQGLLAGYSCKNPETGFPAFAFRLHQFISRGDTVYASLRDRETAATSPSTASSSSRERIRRFCFPWSSAASAARSTTASGEAHGRRRRSRVFEPRELSDRSSEDDDRAPAFSTSTQTDPWPPDPGEVQQRAARGLARGTSRARVGSNRAARTTSHRHVRVGLDGKESERGLDCHFIRAPFRFCLHCGVAYGSRQHTRLRASSRRSAPEGRSTATTILSLSAVRSLRPGREPAGEGAQAAQLHRQPPGRLAAGRPLQRLRRDRPAALGPLPRRARRRRRRACSHDDAHAAGLRGARPAARPSTPATRP